MGVSYAPELVITDPMMEAATLVMIGLHMINVPAADKI
jgi:hypothetical protein